MSTNTAACPVCHGMVGKQEDGSLFPHKRYADGAGPAASQPHTLVYCEGGAAPEWAPTARAQVDRAMGDR
jgi:hypothetical protein